MFPSSNFFWRDSNAFILVEIKETEDLGLRGNRGKEPLATDWGGGSTKSSSVGPSTIGMLVPTPSTEDFFPKNKFFISGFPLSSSVGNIFINPNCKQNKLVKTDTKRIKN